MSLPTYKKQTNKQKTRPVKPQRSHTFLCKGYHVPETPSNPSHYAGVSWKVGKPRVHRSARKGPPKAAGSILSTKRAKWERQKAGNPTALL